ncbi:MAG: hypothetical protein Q8P51_20040 [Ignavibacteria bacterium]|nr:hypothetical protein [Ignavibacteria bacterium]
MTRSNKAKSMRIIYLLPANLISQPLMAAMANSLDVRPIDGFIKIAGVPATVELVY